MIASINSIPRCSKLQIPKKTYKLIEWSGIINFDTAGVPIVSPVGKIIFDNVCSVIKSRFTTKGIFPWQFPGLIKKNLFIKSGRYEKFGKEIFHLHGDRYVLNASIEEFIVAYLKQKTVSYRQLPLYIFSTSKRFRDTAAKRGINRLKEFTMTDLIGVHIDEDNALVSFKYIESIFREIFNELNLNILLCNESFSKRTFFFCLSDEGEHCVQLCPQGHSFEGMSRQKCEFCCAALKVKKAFGVGISMICSSQIISKFAFSLDFKSGKLLPSMASHSLGIERLLYAIVVQHRDEYGVNFPPAVRPFDTSILLPRHYSQSQRRAALKLYNSVNKDGKRCFLDDRIDVCLDEKRFFSDVIGVPQKIAVRNVSDDTPAFFSERRGSMLAVKINRKNRKTL